MPLKHLYLGSRDLLSELLRIFQIAFTLIDIALHSRETSDLADSQDIYLYALIRLPLVSAMGLQYYRACAVACEISHQTHPMADMTVLPWRDWLGSVSDDFARGCIPRKASYTIKRIADYTSYWMRHNGEGTFELAGK